VPRSPRVLAVSVLWLAAAWPLVLLLLGLVQPAAGVRAARLATTAVGWLAWGTLMLGVLAVLVYPPFVPGVRLRLRRIWQQLATADKPVRDAFARLAQLETVNDHFLVGRFLRERRQPAAARKHLQRAVELDPTHTSARYQLALALRETGDLQGAVDELQRVLAADPQLASGQPFLDLAEILEQARLHVEADAVLRRFRGMHGDARAALVLHARALAALGRRDECLGLLRQAAAAPPPGTRVTLEDERARARARVALWFGGFR
jgi:tetratricopeptide (TPR) repeat protein